MNSRDIDRAPVGATLWDDQIRGLHLRVFATKKVFYLRYRIGPHHRRPKLGPYPTLSLAAARRIAQAHLTEVLSGRDPQAATATRPFGDLWAAYYATLAQPGTRREFRRLHDSHLAPLDPRPLDAITEQDCRRLHGDLRSTPAEANRALSALRACFRWGEANGWLPRHASPVYYTAYPEEPRQRYPSAAEARALLDALPETWFRAYVWLLALTGARPGEWRTARWDWINDQGLALPRAKRRSKGRLVALSAAARQVLATVPRIQECPWVFPGRDMARPVQNVQQPWREVCAAAGVTGLQMRDLRRWFASLALSAGTGLDQVGQLLGHTQSQTTRRYAYLMEEARVRAVEGVADVLTNGAASQRRPSSPRASRAKGSRKS